MTRDQIEKKISELKKKQTEFIEQANRQISAFEGGIAVLEELLKEESNGEPKDK